jgi:hypothetical protein
VLSGRDLCDEMITRPEESYRLWCVVVCDIETSRIRRPRPALGRSAPPPPKKKDIPGGHVSTETKPSLDSKSISAAQTPCFDSRFA